MKYGPLILVLLALIACNPDRDKKINKDQVKYTTTADSKLYFKNVRQYYYDRDVPENTKLEVFRFSKRNKLLTIPVVNLSIVNNWMHDEAYVLIEPNTYFEDAREIRLQWKDKAGKQSGEYVFTYGSKDAHFQFASEIYGSIQAGHSLSVLSKDGKWLPLFATNTDQDNFRKTMVDYYRLVNLM